MHLLSWFTNKAFNATRNKAITAQYLPDGELVILVNGRRSPSVDALCREVGIKDTWDYLKSDAGCAYGVHSDRFISSEENI